MKFEARTMMKSKVLYSSISCGGGAWITIPRTSLKSSIFNVESKTTMSPMLK